MQPVLIKYEKLSPNCLQNFKFVLLSYNTILIFRTPFPTPIDIVIQIIALAAYTSATSRTALQNYSKVPLG